MKNLTTTHIWDVLYIDQFTGNQLSQPTTSVYEAVSWFIAMARFKGLPNAVNLDQEDLYQKLFHYDIDTNTIHYNGFKIYDSLYIEHIEV